MIVNPAIAQKITQFSCGTSPEGLPQLNVTPADNRTVGIIEFEAPYFAGSGFTPEVRCREIAPRFQRLYSQGQLKFIHHGEVNKHPVLCGVKEIGDTCTSDNNLITLIPDKNHEKFVDPEEFALQLKESVEQGTGAIRHYGEQINYEGDIRVSDLIAVARRKQIANRQ